MKKIILAYGFFSLFVLIATSSHSQVYPAEQVTVCSDRTLYITGEDILFSASVIPGNDPQAECLSRILYVELVEPDGTRVAGGKYPVENSAASGCLKIPDEIITGSYYLKSYTKWMRNGDQGRYSFIHLKIINPYSQEMIINNENDSNQLRPGVISNGNSSQDSDITLATDKKIFQPGEEVKLHISYAAKQDLAKNYCLAVIPSSTKDSIGQLAETIRQQADSIQIIQYYPETRGISLSGKFLDDTTGAPVPNALINLSIVGDHDVMAIRTNGSGRFNFAIPGYYGTKDIFLCGEDRPGQKASILIDNDFCSRPLNLPSPAFHLTNEESSAALIMAANQKIKSAFYNDTLKVDTVIDPNVLPFYGKPDEVLHLEKFIDLPTVEDYFSELVGTVNVRKFEGRKVFRFNSPRAEMLIYDPLVMVDWVAVNNIDKVLAMSPKLIDRIELVNSPYIKGNITYGGIISFVSKNNDFAGIDLPTSGTFINYKFLDACEGSILPALPGKNLPDARNTVYWNPDLKLDPEGETTVSFTTPATPGNYLILLRTLDGSVMVSEKITVVEISR